MRLVLATQEEMLRFKRASDRQ